MGLLSLAGCSHSVLGPASPAKRLEQVERDAHRAGFESLGSADSGGLPIAAWRRPGDSSRGLRVYIEGDGLAFRSRFRASQDPTPVRATALALAATDPYPGPLLYLGRPCQYAPHDTPACQPALWTAERYGERVVVALDERIDSIRLRDAASPHLELVGYSGGGVVAALLAARRSDVSLLITIAAPLDHAAWTAQAGVPALATSLSPMAYLEALRPIRQVHFSGGQDQRVPPSVIESYQRALGPHVRSTLIVVDAMNHTDWPLRWRELISGSPALNGPQTGEAENAADRDEAPPD